MKGMKKKFFTAALFLMAALVFAKSTPIKNLYQWTLPNGLKLFVAENHAVPLTYIEIAVKCGAFTQEEDTAGLFHLYEHMMFKGNGLYKDAVSVQRALSDMGVASWNGTTGVECVNYFFTVPSDQIEKGLEFWNAAIRFPLLNEKELENEKKVVVSEIQGNLSDTASLYRFAYQSTLFGDAPYKMDPGGSIDSINGATVQKLREIQSKYYVPNNAALFIGGDVNPKEVYKLVKKIYGSWKKAENPFAKGLYRHDQNPMKDKVRYVLPYNQISKDWAQVQVNYRGPDAAFQRHDTFVADGLISLCRNPKARFMKNVCEDKTLDVPDTDYVGFSCPTYRQCGSFSFSVMLPDPTKDLVMRTEYFLDHLDDWILDCAKNTKVERQVTVRQLTDSRAYETETASGLLNALRYYWICADEFYYYDYINEMGVISNYDLVNFANKYIVDKGAFVLLLVNPECYAKYKDDFDKAGYKEIRFEDVVWFSMKSKSDAENRPQENGSSENGSSENGSSESAQLQEAGK